MTPPGPTVLRFSAALRIKGINPYVRVSAAQANRLQPDWRRPMPVKVRLNGQPRRAPWKINLMPAGGGHFLLYLHGTVRQAAAVGVDDRVALEISFDPGYRGGPSAHLTDTLKRALAGNRKARHGWDGLTPSRQKEIARYLANLKTPAARERNLKRTMDILEGKGGRFMARDW